MSSRDQALLDEPGWFISGNGYVMRELPKKNGKRRVEYLHRAILKARPGEVVDHLDGDPLNNRRSNIRITTYAINRQRGCKGFGSSRFIGVSKKRNRWQAKIKNKTLGCFDTQEEAARAYDRAAIEVYGKHCALNGV